MTALFSSLFKSIYLYLISFNTANRLQKNASCEILTPLKDATQTKKAIK